MDRLFRMSGREEPKRQVSENAPSQVRKDNPYKIKKERNQSKEGADAMTQVVEDYFKKRISEQMSEHDKETVKVLLQNGASVDLIKKSFPTLSVEYISSWAVKICIL